MSFLIVIVNNSMTSPDPSITDDVEVLVRHRGEVVPIEFACPPVSAMSMYGAGSEPHRIRHYFY